MKTLVQFAVVRFMPFAETQEFANVGVVAYAPKIGLVDFKLAPTRFKRVTEFFDDLDGQLFFHAITSFEGELLRIKHFAKKLQGRELVDLMTELTRVREGIMVFGETGAILTANPETVIEQLFDTYVGRNFQNNKEYREAQMVKALRKELTQNLTVKFKELSLNTDYSSFKLPLVAKEANIVKAIKPLAFDQKTPLALADHGDRWISRIKHLINAKAIKDSNFLFAIEKPRSQKDEFQKAFEVVRNGMDELGVHVIPYKSKHEIIEFAHFDVKILSESFNLVH